MVTGTGRQNNPSTHSLLSQLLYLHLGASSAMIPVNKIKELEQIHFYNTEYVQNQ